MVEVWVPYGSTEVCIRVPVENLIGTVEPKRLEACKDIAAAIESSLSNPINSEGLEDIVKSGMKIAVAIRNSTVQDAETNRVILNRLIRIFSESGIKNSDVTVISAYDPTVARSPSEPQDLGLPEKVKYVVHDPWVEELNHVGETPSGRKILLNRFFHEADIKIVIGFVEVHPYAGFSSCMECIFPGLADYDSTRENQILALNPKAKPGNTDGNPVFEGMAEAASLVDVDFSIHIVREPPSKILQVYSGDMLKTFNQAKDLLSDAYGVKVEEAADIVFCSPGGSPHDDSLFNSCPALINALDFLDRRGILVMVAECSKGYGEESFYKSFKKFRNPEKLLKKLRRNFVFGEYMAYRLLEAKRKARVSIVTAMPRYYSVGVFGMETFRTANEALEYAMKEAGKNAKITVLTNGNLTFTKPNG